MSYATSFSNYTLQTNLKSHQVIHTGEKKFTCKVCGKLFGYKTSLLHHIKTHDGDKPYQCPHCDKRFTQNGNLQEHIRIHTGEKPFVCTFENCGRRFTTSSQHRNHEKRHRGIVNATTMAFHRNLWEVFKEVRLITTVPCKPM